MGDIFGLETFMSSIERETTRRAVFGGGLIVWEEGTEIECSSTQFLVLPFDMKLETGSRLVGELMQGPTDVGDIESYIKGGLRGFGVSLLTCRDFVFLLVLAVSC